MDLEKRIRMAAESILENESLREGLEDEGASALLDWGIARAKQIANDTANLEDETEAEETSYPRMRALRQMLRAIVSLYATTNVEALERDAYLQEIASQVALVYGSETFTAQTTGWAAFVAAQSGSVAQNINGFRALIENKPNSQVRERYYNIE
jgi:hypothetical protein